MLVFILSFDMIKFFFKNLRKSRILNKKSHLMRPLMAFLLKKMLLFNISNQRFFLSKSIHKQMC